MRTPFSRPWFFPRGVGDSIRLFGDDFPERAALHPLAPDGPDWYRYGIVDSQRVVRPDGEPIRLYSVEVTPRRPGAALVAGFLLLDAARAPRETAERMTPRSPRPPQNRRTLAEIALAFPCASGHNSQEKDDFLSKRRSPCIVCSSLCLPSSSQP